MNQLWTKACLPLAVFTLLSAITTYHLAVANMVSAMARPTRFDQSTLLIDAGHGGEDGGAVSPAGTVESTINLAVAKRLDAVLGLFGVDVVMLRTEDISLHNDDATTLRQKKVSDLHNRVATIEAMPNATLISIHQNSYPEGEKYRGAQVFYSNPELSLSFAQFSQEILRQVLDPYNVRNAAKIPDTVYLMKHVTCRAILVECGFLTHPEEDMLLQTAPYQIKIAVAIAAAYLGYEDTTVIEGEPLHES